MEPLLPKKLRKEIWRVDREIEVLEEHRENLAGLLKAYTKKRVPGAKAGRESRIECARRALRTHGKEMSTRDIKAAIQKTSHYADYELRNLSQLLSKSKTIYRNGALAGLVEWKLPVERK